MLQAIIHAIAGVHKLSLEKAEEKYRSGPCFSNRYMMKTSVCEAVGLVTPKPESYIHFVFGFRERQEFDMMIEQQMKLKETTLRRKQKE